MEHRGIEFSGVRTMSPNGWRWSVKRDDHDKVGETTSRETAIMRATKFIDELIKSRHRGSGK
jgi:hypothetical protein